MEILIISFAVIGLYFSIRTLWIFFQIALDCKYKKYYKGLQLQISESVQELKEIIKDESPENEIATWALNEIDRISTTREVRCLRDSRDTYKYDNDPENIKF